MNGYVVTLWVDTELDAEELAAALEQGELWEKASVQYQIEPARG